MPVTEEQIQGLLRQIKTLLDQIMPLREKAATLNDELAAARRDYERVVGAANAEFDRLRARKATLQAQLAAEPPPPRPPESGAPKPPPVVYDGEPGAALSTPASEDPRTARKRALADFIYCFVDDEQEDVLHVLHAIQSDSQRDVGDMLELLPWGDIWQVRADWETLDDQRRRLSSWLAALETRRDHWKRTRDQLAGDRRQGLLQEKKARSAEAWQDYLAGLARDQETENARLRGEIQILEAEVQKKRAQEA